MSEQLVVVSRVRNIAKEKDKRIGRDAIERLSSQVYRIVKKAIKRANEDGVATVKAKHMDPDNKYA